MRFKRPSILTIFLPLMGLLASPVRAESPAEACRRDRVPRGVRERPAISHRILRPRRLEPRLPPPRTSDKRTTFKGAGQSEFWLFHAVRLHQDQLRSHGASLFRIVFVEGRVHVIASETPQGEGPYDAL